MYNLGYFKMPDPVGLKDDKDWLEIPRISKTIPFGYEEHKKMINFWCRLLRN